MGACVVCEPVGEKMADNAKPQGKPKRWSPEVDSALHVLKGAVVAVLNYPVTSAVQYSNARSGRLAVMIVGDVQEPTQEQLKQIEERANECIARDIPFVTETLPRKEAEEKYNSNPVNGTFIYDRVPRPASIDPVSVTLLHGWNVNCCTGPHVESTGKLRRINIVGHNFRPEKKSGAEVELRFEFEGANEERRSRGGEAAAQKKKPKKENKKDNKKGEGLSSSSSTGSSACAAKDYARETAESVVDLVRKGIKDNGELTADVMADVMSEIVMLRNQAYAEGMFATR